MNFYTPKQIAERWGITTQLVRRYCKEGRIKSAIQYDGGWLIPEGAAKPCGADKDEQEMPRLVKQLRYQHARNNHFGIYEYIQVNLAYSSNRIASNRLTRQQVSMLRSEYDLEDGRHTWEVEFRQGLREYSVRIDAETGETLEWERE